MDRKTAEKIIKLLKDIDHPINDILALTDDIQNCEEQRAIRKQLSRIIGTIYIDLMIPICKNHPDLLPDTDHSDIAPD